MRAAFAILTVASIAPFSRADDFPKPYDSEPVKTGPVSPVESVAGMTLPKGFRASLFAAEPEIRQPIAMTYDGKGRLWVAENYTYAEVKLRFDESLRDRILLFEDSDGDGRHDKRTVFWDQGMRLTSVEVGFGGVFALAPPHLLFIPDKDRDDMPDGEPVVLLDGFSGTKNHHTLANGLKWGPDGWLYGRQGIQDTSRVGVPGTPERNRVSVNGSIWRYHPTKKRFEVVAEGTTNPWGMDWDEHGQAFFINTVIGHLWHVVPGAHYVRMYGQDPGPLHYGLINQTADHFHWDTRDSWVVTRTAGVTDGTDLAGGGHAHTGLLIYQGSSWPEAYRGELFTINFHGRRLNRDHLERRGATYVGKHRPDFVRWSDPWFRGIDLISGPDGGVMVSDWSDTGECHENDGVHRTSGRLFKIGYGRPEPQTIRDVAALDDSALVDLQTHKNIWFVNQARRVLQERAAAGVDLTKAKKELRLMLEKPGEVVLRLRALWCLHVVGGLSEENLTQLLDDENEHVRTWAVKLLSDFGPPSPAARKSLVSLAERESSGLVLAFLASTLQRLDPADRWSLAAALLKKSSFASDPVFPYLIWFGMESIAAGRPEKAAELAANTEFAEVRRFIARRLATENADTRALLAASAESKNPAFQKDVLDGIADAHVQDRRAPKPAGWDAASPAFTAKELRPLARELGVLFGDSAALAEIRSIAGDARAPDDDRRAAIRALVRFRPEGTLDFLKASLTDRLLSAEAVRGLAAFGDGELPRRLLEAYPGLSTEARIEALTNLASRAPSTALLLDAVKSGRVDPKEIPAFIVSLMRNHAGLNIPERLAEHWPVGAKAKAKLDAWKTKLSDGRLPKASLERGRAVFQKTCATCHKLFGEGGSVGPELTGAQRSDLGYLLENILDPSSTLAGDYRMSIFALADGRTVNGLVVERTPNALTIQTPTDRIVVRPDEVEAEKKSNLSLMPDGLLDPLSEQQVADLIRYLQSPRSAP